MEITSISWLPIVLMSVAFVVTSIAYPFVLALARRYGIVDNPSARKLQRRPVPVMGGGAVFIGLLAATIVGLFFLPGERILKLTTLLTVIFAIGVWDDIRDISAEVRFVVELLIVWLMILLLDVQINDFHGFLGIHELPEAVSVPFSLIAGVGIINAINLIDGVDGYCSTYGMMACSVFAFIFWKAGAIPLLALSLITIGALLPFFFHNVFGKTSKMFLGDGGSLMLGMLLAFFTMVTLTSGGPVAVAFEGTGLSLPALCLAVLAVPVFDTLKVMTIRLYRRQSPFHPDKNHLHHLYIEMNYSHMSTSAIIVLADMAIIALQQLSWLLGAGATLQVVLVMAAAVSYTWGFYFFMEGQRRKNDGEGSALWKRTCKRAQKWSFTTMPVSRFIRTIVDSRALGGDWSQKKVPDAPIPFSGSVQLDPRIGDSPSFKGKSNITRTIEEE